jgi:DHA1 family bicyclomycin/chloramphenicol resistance-like MFS transporter
LKTTSARTLTLVLATLAMLGPFATDTYLPSFVAIGQQFSVGPMLVQQTFSIYLFGYSLMTLFYGTLSDSFGRRPVILASLLIFIAGSIGATLAPSFTWLLVFRAMQGMSAGAGMVIGQAIVRDRLSGADAQKMIAQIMMVFGIAPAVAPVIGGLLQVTFGWRAVFAFMAAIALLLLVACRRYLPESLPPSERQPLHLGSIAGNYWKAIRHPQFLLRSLGIGFCFGGFGLYIASAASFVMQVLHLPETAFAWLFIPLITGIVLGSAVNARAAHRVSMNVMIRSGLLVMGLACAINLLYTSLQVAAVPWAVLPVMLYAFGMALALPGMVLQTLGLFPRVRGLAASLQNFVQMLIFALVSGYLAPLLFDSAFKLAAGLAAAWCLGVLFWRAGRAPA